MFDTPWQTSLWQCEGCREILGATDFDGWVWLKAAAARRAEIYENAIVLVCACGVTNRLYKDTRLPQDPEHLRN